MLPARSVTWIRLRHRQQQSAVVISGAFIKNLLHNYIINLKKNLSPAM